MIFKLNDKDTVRKLNPHINELKGFLHIKDDAIRLAIYMYDYESPFRYLPEEGDARMNAIRREVVKFKDYSDDRWERVNAGGSFTKAARMIKSLIYDDEIELYISYCNQLASWAALLNKKDKSDKEQDQAIKIAKDMLSLIDVKKEMELKLGKRIDDGVKDRIKQSTIELFMEEWDGDYDSV